MRIASPLRAIGLLGSVALLTACSGGSNDFVAPPTGVVTPVVVTPPPPPPDPVDPPPAGSAQEQAGAGFAFAFNQSRLDEPVDPMEGDIIAVDKTAEPIDIPNP